MANGPSSAVITGDDQNEAIVTCRNGSGPDESNGKSVHRQWRKWFWTRAIRCRQITLTD